MDAVVGPTGPLVIHALHTLTCPPHHVSSVSSNLGFSYPAPGDVNLDHLVTLVSASLHHNVATFPFVINKYSEGRYPDNIPKRYSSLNLNAATSAPLMTPAWISNNYHDDSDQKVIFCFHPTLLYGLVYILLKGESCIHHIFIHLCISAWAMDSHYIQ